MAVMKREKGFTVIEVVIVVVVLIVLAVFFIIQRNGLEEASRDQERKTAINAMYYSLTEGFYAENGYYPRTISREQLPTVDPTLFTDPSGYTHYLPADCDNDGKCKSFTLSADLETEADYQKKSDN